MDGRFPFNGGGQQPELSAQMRAALGLPAGSTLEDVMYLQQQQRQQDMQREQLRQMILQEQLEQRGGGLGLGSMLQEQQLRSMGDRLGDYPDLQQHYHSLLLNEQIQRNEERAMLEAQAQMRYQDELRLQQQLQQGQREALAPQVIDVDQAHSQAHSQAHPRESTEYNPQALAVESQPQLQLQVEAEAQPVTSNVELLRGLAADSLAGNAMKKKKDTDRKRSAAVDPDGDAVASKEPAFQPMKRAAKEFKAVPKAKKAKTKTGLKSKTKSAISPGSKSSSKANKAVPHSQLHQEGKKKRLKKTSSTVPKPTNEGIQFLSPQSVLTPGLPPGSAPSDRSSPLSHSSPILNPVILDAAMSEYAGYVEASPRLGTVECLLAAADAEDKEETALYALRNFKSVDCADVAEEPEMSDEPALVALKKGEFVKLSDGFVSELPRLPQEPLYDGPMATSEYDDLHDDILSETSQHPSVSGGADQVDIVEVGKAKAKTRTISNVLEYPYAIDVWWPFTSGIKEERRKTGEESDEDNFEEESPLSSESLPFKTNQRKIQDRLTQDLKPGVLEKLPHCKLHRLLMRRKKNLPVPDLVYCWQVSDMYPNDTIVCCSMCGTWRHAACGGHHAPYSVRENTNTPFVALCDHCHEEEKILEDHPKAQARLERQRMEQIRRGLSTSAVMRHASFAKHGGNYKWPLGRVSATHLTGHTRSVHSRHDKAEKQWSDMVARLGSGYGHRPRERARVRTKELERLLVSVEDAENYTDRHNILLFLQRDTMREHPIGFEQERRNIFDPEEDPSFPEPPVQEAVEEQTQADVAETNPAANDAQEVVVTTAEASIDGESAEPEKVRHICSRRGCLQQPRFDSLFCSDSCGVSSLELDLLHSFQESSDIHPSVLRN